VRSNPGWHKDIGGDFNTDRAEFESTPLRRTGTLPEVANTALFLASDESSNITGGYICCTGGRYL
jgi:NAD(P)-dependent dehydrogenase (short-subunit alcohol dehydrogenase family)